MGQTRPLFVYFRPFLSTMTSIPSIKIDDNEKSLDGVLGIRTRDCHSESAELWQLPNCLNNVFNIWPFSTTPYSIIFSKEGISPKNK